ncbi:MAG: MotA/TolQ/ExbB proton channel family protein [Lentisphaerae bacterium]|nr:MotA/TolQ/ExbB proton channel family protein [Lentisphaerota bacterium]
MKKSLLFFGLLVGFFVAVQCFQIYAQGPAAPVAAPAVAAPAVAPAAEAPAGGAKGRSAENMSFSNIVFRSGWFGLLIWIGLFGSSIICMGLVIDSFLNIRVHKIAPTRLVQDVNQAISQGDLAQAIELCERSSTPLGRILKAGFMNVQEGFEVVQDSVGVSADIESETLLARISYLSVISNVTPMLGLIGTVQGMIYAFFNLGTQEAGAAQQAMLAVNISHGLWATAIGLGVSVPASIMLYFFKNRTMRIILGMEALTLDITKTLRNAVVVEDEQA